MNIIWNPSPNYTSGRRNRNIIAIVDHITAGSYPGCLSWLCNTAAKSSAHYLITKTGQVYQLVREADTAWHAGIVNKPSWKLHDGTNPNFRTIGIEHECLSGGQLTEPQYQATLQLHKELCEKYNIPIDRNHIIGHYEINSVDRPGCPGPNFPWTRLMSDLQKPDVAHEEEKDLTKEELTKILEDFKAELKAELSPKIYRYVEDTPSWAHAALNAAINSGTLAGEGKDGDKVIINLDLTGIKCYVALDRTIKKLVEAK